MVIPILIPLGLVFWLVEHTLKLIFWILRMLWAISFGLVFRSVETSSEKKRRRHYADDERRRAAWRETQARRYGQKEAHTWNEEDDRRYRAWEQRKEQRRQQRQRQEQQRSYYGSRDRERARQHHKDRDKAAAYRTLEISYGSSAREITRAWRKLAFKYHPDRNPDGAARMKAINKARDLLLGKR